MKSAQPQYAKALDAYLQGETKVFARLSQDPALSQAEKKLLRARSHFQTQDYASAETVLHSLATTDAFFLAEKNFLLAAALSYRARWEEACAHAQIAYARYGECADTRGLFISSYNLSVYFNRMGLRLLEWQFLDTSSHYAATPAQEGIVSRAKACYFSMNRDYVKAKLFIQEALVNREQLGPVDQATLDVVAADILFRAGDIDQARTILLRQKENKLLRGRARVFLDLAILKKLADPLHDLSATHLPKSLVVEDEYALRFEVLKQLESGARTLAAKTWTELAKTFPQKYRSESFEFVAVADTDSAFGRLLTEFLRPSAAPIDPSLLASLIESDREVAALFFEKSQSLTKEDIIRHLWRVPYDASLDARFYKRLQRFRKNRVFALTYAGGSYSLKLA